MANMVYVLGALLSTICAFLLLRSYRRAPSHLLLWSGICFFLLALSNIILFTDMVLLPGLDFNGSILRNVLTSAAGSVLLFGFIWELS